MRTLASTFFAALLSGLGAAMAVAEPAPFACTILPGETTASASVTNTLDGEASCLVNCKFSTAKYDDNPEITCAKPIPPGKQIEMCILRSGGEKMLKLTTGRADCRKN